MTNIGFNEGKACDAVIGYLEHREATLRGNCCNPEAALHHAPIDFACRIGNTLFALEHTGIEPFEKYFLFQKYVHHYLDPVSALLTGALPEDVFRLTIRINLPSLSALKLRKKGQTALLDWIRKTAPELPIMREGRDRKRQIDWISIADDFPFHVSLRRYKTVVKPYFIMNFYIADDIEKARVPRIHRACAEHFGKLAIWRRDSNARTVFILEDNDLSLTNETHVVEALLSVEKSFSHRPTEIYLVNTEIKNEWRVRCLRNSENQCCELTPSYLMDVNPQNLVNITGR
jgi:hypothetical protein